MAVAQKSRLRTSSRRTPWSRVAVVAVLCVAAAVTVFRSASVAGLQGVVKGSSSAHAVSNSGGVTQTTSQLASSNPAASKAAGTVAQGGEQGGAAAAAAAAAQTGTAEPHTGQSTVQQSKAANRTLLFYDVGRAYHHLPSCPAGWARPGFGCDIPGSCPVQWDWTQDRQKADAVIYNTLDGLGSWGDVKSQRRPPGQLVVLWAMESGKYYPALYTAKEGGANITADYRLDSDVPVPYYTPWEFQGLDAMPVPFAKKRKDGLVAVFISNCNAKNAREQVLADLMKLLPGMVHSYGRCQHNKDTSASKIDTFSTYKFAFTPENSHDPGYVTEKLYHALQAGTVPIYMGAPDIQRLIPVPEAVISVADFSSTQALADYLKKAAEDESIYNKHVAWKKKPEAEWSPQWQALRRLTKYSSHCRLAMHIAGQPHVWQNG